jgi:hypothetical protein
MLIILGTITLPGLYAQVSPAGRNFALPRVDASITYSAVQTNAGPGQCGCFFMNGGSTEVAMGGFRGMRVVTDVTVEHTDQVSKMGQTLSLLMVTAGPRINYRIGSERFWRYRPFIQGLLGVAHGFDSAFPDKAGFVESSANSFVARWRRTRGQVQKAHRLPRYSGGLRTHAATQRRRKPAKSTSHLRWRCLPRLVSIAFYLQSSWYTYSRHSKALIEPNQQTMSLTR